MSAYVASETRTGVERLVDVGSIYERRVVRLLGHEAIRVAAGGELCWCERCAGRVVDGRREHAPGPYPGPYVHRYGDPIRAADRWTVVLLERPAGRPTWQPTAEEIAAEDPALVWIDVPAASEIDA